MNKKLLFQFLFLSAFVISLFLFLQQGGDSGITIPHADKFGHFVIFFTLALLFDLAYRVPKFSGIILLFIYGVAIELIQGTLATREASFADAMADLIGVLAYYFVVQKKLTWAGHDVCK